MATEKDVYATPVIPRRTIPESMPGTEEAAGLEQLFWAVATESNSRRATSAVLLNIFNISKLLQDYI